jgi:hypothetical protein
MFGLKPPRHISTLPIGENSVPLADDSFGAGWAIEVDAGLGRLSLSFRPTSGGAALAVRTMSRPRQKFGPPVSATMT